jgi:HAE1 family hydrophobic/amphiphilic exporter-1
MAIGGGLSGLAIRRPVFTAMVMVALVVLGTFSFRRLAIDQFPNVEFPVVAVQTIYPGASPESIEREVTRRLEEAFNTVQGVDEILSYSFEGASQVIVFFELERDVDQAAQDVRAKIDAVRRDLPVGIEPPVVQKFDPAAMPIISLALSSETLPVEELTLYADEAIRRQLESIAGVGEVRITGGLEREVRVSLLPDRLQATGVSVPEVMGALQRQNLEVPAGRIERGQTDELVRVTGRITEARQFDEVVVATRQGQPIRLGEVARVEVGTEEQTSAAFVSGERAVGLDVVKVSGANTVEVADEVKEAVAGMTGVLPSQLNIQVVRDNSTFIRHSVEDVIFELLLGALLTVFIVMIFLNDWKATIITALALPVSVISAFLIMNALGFTLNMVTLMGLALSIGILIDDAIVVIENIVRHREMGKDHFTAAGEGTREIILAVMATTFSIVAVFVPVAFMGGIVGQFFYEFGITVAWAVLISLLVSFTLTPMLSAWWGVDPHGAHEAAEGNLLQRGIARFDAWFDRLADGYRGVIGWALDHRGTTLGITTAAFVLAILLFPFVGAGFMPESDEGEFTVTYETPEGASVDYTTSKGLQLASLVHELEGVDYTYTTIGGGVLGLGGTGGGEIFVKLVPSGERDRSAAELSQEARERLQGVYGVDLAVLTGGHFGGAEQPLQAIVAGPDIEVLRELANALATELEAVPGLADIQLSVGEPRPEYRIDVNRDLANEVGLDIGVIANTVRPLMAGQTATRWEDPRGEEREVVVQVAQEYRASPEQLAALPVTTLQGRIVELGDVATIERGGAPTNIDRQDLQRVISVTATNVEGLSVGEASTAIREQIDEMTIPPGYSVRLGGETEMLEETAGFVVEAILLAIILIYLILASQFESFTQPLAIMLSLPLSIVGVLIALLLTGNTLNMMSMIGVILLMGLVTKNAILLVDNANERRKAGTDRTRALIEAGRVRLRPIIMTTLAMILGMTPIALALGEGSGFRAPMARAVIGGLITSTLLTLIVVPVAYTYLDDLGQWVKRRFVSPEREREIAKETKESGLRTGAAWQG